MAKGKVETKEKDLGFKKIREELRKLEDKPFVKVGLPAEKSKTNKVRGFETGEQFTNLDIGFVQEFGTEDGSVPERSHIRAAFDQNKKKLEKLTDQLVGKIYDGKMTVEDALDILGLSKVTNIQKLIRSGLSPGLKFRSGTPLLDTGQYLAAMTFIRKMKKGK